MIKQTIIAAALLLLCLQSKAQTLFLAKDSVDSKYLTMPVKYDTAQYLWQLLDSANTLAAVISDTTWAVTSPGSLILHDYVEKWDTIVACDTIKPDYIIGITKAGEMYVFGAKYIIHRYKKREQSNNWGYFHHPAKWWDESYDIRGAWVGSLEKMDVMTGYRDWETDRKSTRLNSSHSAKSRMPSSA